MPVDRCSADSAATSPSPTEARGAGRCVEPRWEKVITLQAEGRRHSSAGRQLKVGIGCCCRPPKSPGAQGGHSAPHHPTVSRELSPVSPSSVSGAGGDGGAQRRLAGDDGSLSQGEDAVTRVADLVPRAERTKVPAPLRRVYLAHHALHALTALRSSRSAPPPGYLPGVQQASITPASVHGPLLAPGDRRLTTAHGAAAGQRCRPSGRWNSGSAWRQKHGPHRHEPQCLMRLICPDLRVCRSTRARAAKVAKQTHSAAPEQVDLFLHPWLRLLLAFTGQAPARLSTW